jgi:acyl carrier protein
MASNETEKDPAGQQQAIEEAVMAAFASFLEIQEFARDDDFFALGGHSILAMKLNLLVSEQLGVEIPLRTLFDAPTVRGFSSAIAELTN